MLYFAATPIGNLKDVTLRVLELMSEADYIICENTGRTGTLLKEYNIKKSMKKYNDYNKEKRTNWIIEELKQGKNIVFVTSAGSPLVSDPGYYLVKSLIKNNLNFTSLPGPSSVINSLILSGMPPDRFVFEGYLPRKKGKRTDLLKEIKNQERTTIIFESPRRIERLLDELEEILPERQITLVKEMTKVYETVIRGKPSAIRNKLPPLKGEFIILIGGREWNGIN